MPARPWVLPVRDIVKKPGQMREHDIEASLGDDVGTGLVRVEAGQPARAEVRLESVHEGMLASGSAEVMASATCARCLQTFDLDLKVEFQDLFGYDRKPEFDYQVENDTVDLLPIVRDAVVLSLPFQPVDRPDCAGLDPVTGERLEPGTTYEPEQTIDPRWAALQEFQRDVTGETSSGEGAEAQSKE